MGTLDLIGYLYTFRRRTSAPDFLALLSPTELSNEGMVNNGNKNQHISTTSIRT